MPVHAVKSYPILAYPMLHFGGLTGNTFPLAVLHKPGTSCYILLTRLIKSADTFWNKLLNNFVGLLTFNRQPCHLITTCPQTCPQHGHKPSEHIQISSSLKQGCETTKCALTPSCNDQCKVLDTKIAGTFNDGLISLNHFHPYKQFTQKSSF